MAKYKSSFPSQGRGGSFISDAGSRPNFMTDVEPVRPERSHFDLSKEVKTTFDMGYLVPCYVGETLPTGKYTLAPEIIARFQALASPVMHEFDLTTETFHVPYRLLWDNWTKSLMSVHDGNPSPPAMPYFTNLNVQVGSPADYFGLPLGVIDTVSPFAFSAMNFIWNEYYRNPAIDTELPYKLVDGLNPTTNFNILLKKRWGSDYFTRALPAPQAGAPVTFPITGSVRFKGLDPNAQWVAGAPNATGSVGGAFGGTADGQSIAMATADPVNYDPADSLETISNTLTVSDWRLGMRMQEWAERAMRFIGGSKGKYVDFMRGFFNSRIPDGTLQRPIYLGGTSMRMNINGVTQTSESATTPLGELAGQGVAVGAGKAFSYTTDEHGLYISFICVRPKPNYMQGLPKMFSKFDPIDFGHSDFVHLSEQPIKNKEVYYNSADGLNDNDFGFQPIYSDYRYANGSTHGQFRTSQSYWTEVREFSARPNLNTAFIECTPSNRIFAVQGAPMASQIQCRIYWHCKAYLPLPFYGTPRS